MPAAIDSGGVVATQAVHRRVYRSRDAYIGGVCAGLAEHFELDVIVTRILAILISASTLGLGVIAYIVLWVALPPEPESNSPRLTKQKLTISFSLSALRKYIFLSV